MLNDPDNISNERARTMYYDESTGDMIDEKRETVDDCTMDEALAIAMDPLRSECSLRAYEDEMSIDEKSASTDFCSELWPCAIGLLAGVLIGVYSPHEKVMNWWKSHSSNRNVAEERREDNPDPNPQGGKWTIACCVCNAELDATHLRHLKSFEGTCPVCNARLHVEQSE